MNLSNFFNEQPVVSIAFSGGVDSAYLLYCAHKYAKKVHAYYMKTLFQPSFEEEDAKRFCTEYNISLTILTCDILSSENIAANPKNRCYYCKRTIFEHICHAARHDGFSIICDGTNASDDTADRPGMKALQELSVFSPLRLCGLYKEQIREESKKVGLFTWDKPAYACLATRIPSNTPILPSALARVEASEGILHQLGFSDYRIRVFHDAARIQLTEDDFPHAVELRKTILALLKPYFKDILLDLEERHI